MGSRVSAERGAYKPFTRLSGYFRGYMFIKREVAGSTPAFAIFRTAD